MPCSKTVFTKGRFRHNKAKASFRFPLPCNIRFSGKSHLKNHRHQKRSFQNRIVMQSSKQHSSTNGKTILKQTIYLDYSLFSRLSSLSCEFTSFMGIRDKNVSRCLFFCFPFFSLKSSFRSSLFMVK